MRVNIYIFCNFPIVSFSDNCVKLCNFFIFGQTELCSRSKLNYNHLLDTNNILTVILNLKYIS